MARVNHKLIKQLLNEKRSKITDRQFFLSRSFAGHFEDMAIAQTRRYNYNRRVYVNIVWEPKSPEVAYTNNALIKINAGHPIVTSTKGRVHRYQIIFGLFVHELGHVLYNDFLIEQTYLNHLSAYNWYPTPPVPKTSSELLNEKDIWDYAKADEKNVRLLVQLANNILNILDDGYIENQMLLNFPGSFAYALEDLRTKQFTTMDTVTQLKEQEDNGDIHIFQSILQVMLSYAKYGEIKYGDEALSDERIVTIFNLISDIDIAVTTHSSKERFCVVNTILVRCWEYAKDFIELCKERNSDILSNGGSETEAETLANILGQLAGNTSIAQGDTEAVSSQSNQMGSATASQRENTKQLANNSSDEQDDGNNTKQEITDAETGRIPLHQTEKVSAPTGGTIEHNNNYERERYDNAAKDIAKILDKMAEKVVCKELENERIRELNDMAKNISYGDIHSGIDIRVNRINSVDEDLVDQYNEIAAPLLNISKQLQRSLIHQFRDSQRGGKHTGLIFGRRLDTHALCRNDGKVFYKTNLPNEIPQLSVGLLLDESGSMSSQNRSTYARAAAIILHNFCESLDIPIMIYGHTTKSGSIGVELFSYAEFEGFDDDDKYRLMDISSRSCNRDGAALRYVAERLSKRTEEVKILILISDGQPNGAGYSGTAAEDDLRGIQHEYQRKGIIFVAAAIGDDKENIKRIYGESFMDITDLNQLPAKLTAVVKRHIRV